RARRLDRSRERLRSAAARTLGPRADRRCHRRQAHPHPRRRRPARVRPAAPRAHGHRQQPQPADPTGERGSRSRSLREGHAQRHPGVEVAHHDPQAARSDPGQAQRGLVVITKITKGARAGDIGAYVHGPGDRDEHTYGGEPGGMVIGGNLGREGARSHKGWAADMHHYAKQAKGKKPIWQASLRNADDDRVLTDEEWSEAGQLFAEEMGYQDRPWVMVRHADDHVHIVMCRQGDDGAMWDDRNDRPRAMAAKSKLEERYGLTQVAVPKTHQAAAERSAHKLTQGEHAKAHRTGETPPRVRLAERVRAARKTAVEAGGREMFEQQLEGLGVEHRATTTKAGEMRG